MIDLEARNRDIVERINPLGVFAGWLSYTYSLLVGKVGTSRTTAVRLLRDGKCKAGVIFPIRCRITVEGQSKRLNLQAVKLMSLLQLFALSLPYSNVTS